MIRKSCIAIPAIALFLAGCGGSGTDQAGADPDGSGSGPVATNPGGGEPFDPGTDPLEEVNVIMLSDAILDLDDRRARLDTWECREDLSFICTARLGKLQAYADPRGEFDYRVAGEWDHMHVAGVVHDGTALFAATAGASHRNSLPAGTATWTGSMVGVHRPPETPLGERGRVVRGGAEITLRGLDVPAVDVVLTPRSLPAMAWEAVPVAAEFGEFEDEWAVTADAPWPGPPNRRTYIRGGFYGPGSEEVGGVFERGGIIGAFGAGR